jgi:gamma-glutamylcyclotransferase (GGCT)/AIG2-like uncharacterized protein YtfP
MAHRVFVYGTLLSGEPNNHWLAHAKLLGRATTLFGFTLYNRGPYPVLADTGVGTGTSVKGEVYEVDDVTLACLDRLEGHPNHYQRTEIALNDGMKAFTYLQAPERCAGMPVIPEGNWHVVSPYEPAARPAKGV